MTAISARLGDKAARTIRLMNRTPYQDTFRDNAQDTLGKQLAILSMLIILSALIFEHSQIDLHISALFYQHGHWLLEKGAQPYAFIFYDLPKALLIVFALYLLSVLMVRYVRQRALDRQVVVRPAAIVKGWSPMGLAHDKCRQLSLHRSLSQLPRRELGYLLLTIILVPAIIATLKSITHVSCPSHLSFFNGELPYLTIWQNMLAHTPAKCFPAAHASAGFSLYGFAYLPSLSRYRSRILMGVTMLGWTMGGYKMLIGDHFFSHSIVSMLLSWSMACALALLFFHNKTKQRVQPAYQCAKRHAASNQL